MHRTIISLIASVLVVSSILVFCQLTRKFVRFDHRSSKFHAQFASACDSMLSRFPLNTNKLVEISTADPSLPQIVRDLRPETIKLSTNWVWILVDDSHTDG